MARLLFHGGREHIRWPDGKDQPGGRPRRERCFTLEHPLPGRRTRLSFNQLAKRLSLSAPSVAARVRHLEDAHVIDGYYARVSAEAIASRSPRSCNCTAISAAAPQDLHRRTVPGDRGTPSTQRKLVQHGQGAHRVNGASVLAATSHIVVEIPFEHRQLESPRQTPPSTRRRLESRWNSSEANR
jgi:DNA-binding Lrp family transcriptional regulator